MSRLSALEAALEIEHQVIYGYGVVGAHLQDGLEASARAALEAHQRRRDALAVTIRRAGGQPSSGAAAYPLPYPVRSPGQAARLGITLESASAGAMWIVITESAARSPDRRGAVQWLAESTRMLDQWTLAVGAQELVALPGQPGAGQPAASQPSTTPTSSPS